MKIRNTSKTIIGLCGAIIYPDSELEVTVDVANLPSVQALVRVGSAVVIDDDNAPAVANDTVEESEEAETKKRGRKPKVVAE